MPKINRTLWRGISVDLYDSYEVGKVITWWSVSSCTADETVARNFVSGQRVCERMVVLVARFGVFYCYLFIYGVSCCWGYSNVCK